MTPGASPKRRPTRDSTTGKSVGPMLCLLMSVDRSGQASSMAVRFANSSGSAYDDRGGAEGFRAKSAVFHESGALVSKNRQRRGFRFRSRPLIRCDQARGKVHGQRNDSFETARFSISCLAFD